MSFFHFLKTIKEVEEILCVDIDDNTLERFACRIMPSTSDFLSRRETPLNVKVLKGSVSEWDSRLKDTNVVVAIELIEHLFPDTLEQLPYSIFGIIQPDIALFTTPNADFNVLFPNFTGFRHDDHKFEWSRQQFIDW
ncbi:hypothetical protein AAG570_008853 [Ranatra chinensis]|uniref:Small RNA 2'-O-methyltransferase n=1 Tax=Ranatra chinensis TaxID=642074 RepID=A0ABD0YS78_9HEMI